jgi:phosphoglycolate phosphatase
VRPRVVLFDLDGTAVTFEGPPPGPGRQALALAMRQLHDVEGATEGLRLAGGTDRALVRSMLVRFGVADADVVITRILAAYLVHLDAVLETRRYRPVGDVAGTVAALRARGAIVGVATGNVRDGARLKLASAGLSSVFELAMGGFGCDAELRAEIVRIAAERCVAATHAGSDANGTVDLVVVGDTEHDVRAARAVGARVVGVALSERARAELEAAGADAIVSACDAALVSAVFDESRVASSTTHV